MKTYVWKSLSAEEQAAILQRAGSKNDLRDQVGAIIKQVQSQGDQALINFAAQFDQVQLTSLQILATELEAAQANIMPQTLEALRFAAQTIKAYHQAQSTKNLKVETYPGITCERQARPIDAVGLYIPGGSAPLVSTVLMLGVPAQLAGGKVRVLCTPPNKQGQIDANILVAAKLCGIEQIYKVGGAQAIAAMAYGTETIPKVAKIFGPGNAWVTTAKMLVAQDPKGALIDMPAGPSELLVIADETANPAYVAADLLSQAEHGPDSQVILISTAKTLLEKVAAEVVAQTLGATRRTIIEQSLKHARLIEVDDLTTAVRISNDYAPEHLILNVKDKERYTAKIINAGAVFLGPWSAETFGDYLTGSNHVLPTNGYAKAVSGLGLNDFMKYISFQTVSQSALKSIGPYAEQLASLEGLSAHKNAISLRLQGS